MTISRSAIRLVLGFGAILAVAASAKAQTSHLRFVASTGSDANSCLTAATACRTLQHAVDLVSAGGEVRVVDSFNYGPLTITKSVTISADGAAVIVGGLNINSADAVVTLRGLVLNGRGVVTNGVNIVNAAAVHIVDCELERFTGDGIQLFAGAELFIGGSVSHDNGFNGLLVRVGGEKVTIEDSRFENNGRSGVRIIGAESRITRSVASGNGDGIVQPDGRMNVTWTTAANNARSGFQVFGAGQMTVESSVARGNGNEGFRVLSQATGLISSSVVTDNGIGIYNIGTLYTRQNNTVAGNTTNTQGTLTPLAGI
jgi:hypothetical protein